MFSKAPIKRYNDSITETPAPGDYDPKEAKSRGTNIALSTTTRFNDSKSVTPGPGAYDVDVKKPGSAKSVPRNSLAPRSVSNLSKASSRTSSNTSLNNWVEADEDICFKTPSKLPIIRRSGGSEELENKIVSLQREIKAKNEAIERVQHDKDDLEVKFDQLQGEFEVLRVKTEALEDEMKHLDQENKGLENKLLAAQNDLDDEKKTLDEKSTFLHFTQEQLNVEIENLTSAKNKMTAEIDNLKTLLQSKEQELKSEKVKVEELTDTYNKDNNDYEREFVNMTTMLREKDENYAKLFKQKQTMVEATFGLHDEVKELNAKIDDLKLNRSRMQGILEEMEADIEVHVNDKFVLEQEMKRFESEKNEMALDLASFQHKKNDFETQLTPLNTEKDILVQQVETLLKEKGDLEVKIEANEKKIEEFQAAQEELEKKYHELSEITDEQDNGLMTRETEVFALKHEIQELEMKNSSLEGTLSSVQNEVANLTSENASLFNSFESIESSLRSYVHENEKLTDQINNLESLKEDVNETCLILETRMLNAETTVCDQQEDIEKLVHEIDSKDAELEELVINIEEMESKANELEGLVQLLEERHSKTEELQQETLKHYEKTIADLKQEKQNVQDTVETANFDLSNVRREKTDLVDMNENLSNQISEQLNGIKKLQDHEQDLMQKVENSKRDLELAHNGMTAELQKHWEAEDDLMNMQNVLDETDLKLLDAKCEIQRLNKKISDESQNDKHLEEQFEAISVNYVNAQADLEQKEEDIKNLSNELSKTNTLLQKLKLEAEGKKELAKKLNQTEKEANKMKNNLEIKDEEISSLSLSLETQQKLIAENEDEIYKLKFNLVQAENLSDKVENLQLQLVSQDEELAQLKNDKESQMEQIKDKDKVIGILRQELDPLQENAKSFKEKYEALCKMIEPFREQLESFETERSALLTEKRETQGKMTKLFDEYANLLGHQNHKQKIHHLVRLKQENLDMREELAKVNLELNKQKRLVGRLKEHRSMSKENLPLSVLNTPLNKTPAIRRQTIASPLSIRNRNGQR